MPGATIVLYWSFDVASGQNLDSISGTGLDLENQKPSEFRIAVTTTSGTRWLMPHSGLAASTAMRSTSRPR